MAAPTLNSGDQPWMLVSTALVQLMTPGLSFYYGGLVSEQAVISTLMGSFGSMGVITLLWSVAGYGIAFGPNMGEYGVVGDASYSIQPSAGLNDAVRVGTTISESIYCTYQLMFAIITGALISGSVIGKMKYWWWLAFTALWHLLVYCILAHWIFYYDGFLFKYGVLDYAGGMVVHMSSGISAFVLAFWLDYDRPRQPARRHISTHNVPYVLLGAALLWFGWFGFNAGSALGASVTAGRVFYNTQLAASAAMFTMGGLETIFSSEGYFKGRPTAVGAATAAIIGLVGITPGCGFVSPMWSIFIGAATCAAVFAVPNLVRKCGVDDSLDCFAIHGVGGLVGTLLTGLFANADVSGFGAPSVFSGGFFGNGHLLAIQIAATLITFVYSAFFTTVIYWFLFLLATRVFGTDIRLRGEQSNDPDASLHGETGYTKAAAKTKGSPTSSLTFPLEPISEIGEPTSTASEVAITVPAPAAAAEVRA